MPGNKAFCLLASGRMLDGEWYQLQHQEVSLATN